MAKGSLNLHVSKQDFITRIETINQKMTALKDVIDRYNNAKANLDQFVEEGDSTYEEWVRRIDINIENCGKAYASLQESKQSLEKTVEQMEGMGAQLKETVSSATEAAQSTIDATLKVASIL